MIASVVFATLLGDAQSQCTVSDVSGCYPDGRDAGGIWILPFTATGVPATFQTLASSSLKTRISKIPETIFLYATDPAGVTTADH